MTTYAKMKNWIEANGYKIIDDRTHREPLPSGFVWVSTDRNLIDGETRLFVYPDRVILGTLRYPTLHSNWNVARTFTYNSPDELKGILDDLTQAEKARAWE